MRKPPGKSFATRRCSTSMAMFTGGYLQWGNMPIGYRYFVDIFTKKMTFGSPNRGSSENLCGYCKMGKPWVLDLGLSSTFSDKAIWICSGGKEASHLDRWWTRFEVGRKVSRLDFSILSPKILVESHIHIKYPHYGTPEWIIRSATISIQARVHMIEHF